MREYSEAANQDRHGILVDYDVFMKVSPPGPDPRALYKPADFDFRLRPGSAAIDAGVRLPGVNGLELQSHLVARGHQVPIIFITAFNDEDARAQALKSGALAYLVKPFEEADLLNAINLALQRQENAPGSRH